MDRILFSFYLFSLHSSVNIHYIFYDTYFKLRIAYELGTGWLELIYLHIIHQSSFNSTIRLFRFRPDRDEAHTKRWVKWKEVKKYIPLLAAELSKCFVYHKIFIFMFYLLNMMQYFIFYKYFMNTTRARLVFSYRFFLFRCWRTVRLFLPALPSLPFTKKTWKSAENQQQTASSQQRIRDRPVNSLRWVHSFFSHFISLVNNFILHTELHIVQMLVKATKCSRLFHISF